MGHDDLGDDYRTAGFSARLGAGRRPALVLVDALQGYVDPSSPLHLGQAGDRAVEAMAATLDLARRHGDEVVFTRVAYRPDGHDGGMFRRKVPALDLLVEGSTASQIAPPLAPRAGEVVLVKEYASAFFATPLAAHLHARGVDTVVLVGFSTSGCVRASAVDACQHGFRTLVVAEGVADRAPGPHDANLFDLDAKYADVVALADLEDTLRAGRA